MKQALLIIDIQNDYFPEGKNELHEADKALLKVNQLENSFCLNKSQLFIFNTSSIS